MLEQQALVALCTSFACHNTANVSGDVGTDNVGSNSGTAPRAATDSPLAGALGMCMDVTSSITCPAAIVCVQRKIVELKMPGCE